MPGSTAASVPTLWTSQHKTPSTQRRIVPDHGTTTFAQIWSSDGYEGPLDVPLEIRSESLNSLMAISPAGLRVAVVAKKRACLGALPLSRRH